MALAGIGHACGMLMSRHFAVLVVFGGVNVFVLKA